jgi:hypothetical protein
LMLLVSCGNKESDNEVMLSLHPDAGKKIKLNYVFSVSQLKSGDVTTFSMDLSGNYGKDEGNNTFMQLTNENVGLSGNVKGQAIEAVANGTDTLENEVRLVAMPVFNLAGKTFKSVFDPQFNRLAEFQVSNGNFVDSTESKVQMLLRYPEGKVTVGQTWERDIVIKTGNKMNCSAKYTLREIKGDSALISVEGKIYGKGQSFGNEISFDGKLNGNFNVNIKDGTPWSFELSEEFNLSMNEEKIPMNYTISARFQ